MALRELERLTQELKDLTQLLRQESRSEARWVIFIRMKEIIALIGEGSQT